MTNMREAKQREFRIMKEKYTSNDYKQYKTNFGFGRDFLPFENECVIDKKEKVRKRQEYSRRVRERNGHLLKGLMTLSNSEIEKQQEAVGEGTTIHQRRNTIELELVNKVRS